jgi:hypothetical protein
MTVGTSLCAAFLELVDRLAITDIVWALTESLGHCLQGVPPEIQDIDVQTDEPGAYQIAERFKEAVIRPVHGAPMSAFARTSGSCACEASWYRSWGSAKAASRWLVGAAGGRVGSSCVCGLPGSSGASDVD